MKHHFKLQYGIEWQGKIHFQAALKPLTIGAELVAMAQIEDLPALPDKPSPAQEAQRAVHETLIYWAQQLHIDGIPQENLTADFLLHHLSGADYAQIFDEQSQLRTKSAAASEQTAPTQAAEPASATGAACTNTTAKP